MTRRWFPWMVIGLLVLAAIPLGGIAMIATSVSYSEQPPPCYGLGWGCELSPSDVGVIMAVMWLVWVGGESVLLLVSEMFWRRVAEARSLGVLFVGAIGICCWVVAGIAFFWSRS